MPMILTECPICGGVLEITRVGPPPYPERYWCDECEEFRGYLPLAPEKYGAYVMPFGRYQDFSLVDIASQPGGIGYLGWASLNLRGRQLREIILGYLDQIWKQQEEPHESSGLIEINHVP